MLPKTVQLDKQPYFQFWGEDMAWRILLKKDGNSSLYVPVHRKGWEMGGEVEIFTLLPPEQHGDHMLLHIRIYTGTNEEKRRPARANPAISIQSIAPCFSYVEPEKRRIRVQLMCILSVVNGKFRITPILEEP